MSEEVRARVFEPFFTTKEKGRGTGLGLATVYGIVKQSGGYVWLTTEPGEGTTFDLYFPRVDERVRPEIPNVSGQSDYPRGTETILLLEDEDSLRKVTREFLLESGYKVLSAERGDIAIELATQYKDPISLIISDVVLPEMSGPHAVSKLQALHPEMRVLYVSGYAEVPVAQQLVSEGATVLQKPILRMDLLKKVDQMLHPAK
jgi:CheY-like chemotaxis protein